jgi:iron complex outermembrane recepter protein
MSLLRSSLISVTQFISQARGNPDVRPEEGDSTGIGVVYQPSWTPGLSMSLDYYNIQIDQAILIVGSQEVVDRCYAGNTVLCNKVIRGSDGLIDFVYTQPQNLLAQEARGYDFEASYLLPMSVFNSSWDGDLTLRTMVTYVDKLLAVDQEKTVDGVGVTAGSIGGPGFGFQSAKILYLTMLTYSKGPFSTTLTARGMDSGVYNASYIECDPGWCPAATAEHAATSFWAGSANMLFYERSGRIVRLGLTYEFR